MFKSSILNDGNKELSGISKGFEVENFAGVGDIVEKQTISK